MILKIKDFNGATELISNRYEVQWGELEAVLKSTKLHLKSSDQAGKKGRPIFDPVGTNDAIKKSLNGKKWNCNLPIPKKYSFFGKDIDFAKGGIFAEVQFSNYPFLLNNLLRSELFFKEGIQFSTEQVAVIVIITKAKMFPASNSSLYYEQAVDQLECLNRHDLFSVPIRLVGLSEHIDQNFPVVWSTYKSKRYSRDIDKRTCGQALISTKGSRFSIKLPN